jgi:hypothetical protein
MRVLDKADPDHPVIRDVPDEIGTAWLTQTSRFELAPPEDTEAKPAEVVIDGVEYQPVVSAAVTAEQKATET